MLDNIEVFTQSSIRIKDKTWTIYVDPFQMKSNPHDADYVFITHSHSDHFSIDDIRKVLKTSTILVVPAKMEDDARELSAEIKSIIPLKPGVYKELSGLEVETIPAYNTVKPFHPRRAEWLGYILRIDGKRVYIAGDTGATKEAKQVRCDIALVPVGGTYTMDVKRAAELVSSPVKVIEKIQYFE